MFDVVIAGPTVWPGDAPPFEGDVAVSAGRIVLVTVCYLRPLEGSGPAV